MLVQLDGNPLLLDHPGQVPRQVARLPAPAHCKNWRQGQHCDEKWSEIPASSATTTSEVTRGADAEIQDCLIQIIDNKVHTTRWKQTRLDQKIFQMCKISPLWFDFSSLSPSKESLGPWHLEGDGGTKDGKRDSSKPLLVFTHLWQR